MPEKYDLDIYQGDTFARTFRFRADATTPEDLTGWTWAAQWRPYAGAAELVAFSVTVPAPATGEVTVRMDAATTAGLTAGVWDLQGTSASETRTRLYGVVRVATDVTR